MTCPVFFKKKYVYVKDGEIVVLLNVLVDSLAKFDCDEWTNHVRETWDSERQGRGFGCYELHLDELVTNQDQKARMLLILEDAMNALKDQGSRISKEWLNALPYNEAIFVTDQEVSKFVEPLKAIEDMLIRDVIA
ncbi:MAG TPA: hypothetical protein VJ783_03320 [Pirellulales bacterium]|nr:hypothetical protein [Pirellulales bacterium]